MSSPANASALPAAAPATSPPTSDRRAFLATLAAAGVMTGAAEVPALAVEISTIELAYADWLHVSRLADAACVATWEIEDNLYQEPERPRWHPLRDEGGYKMEVIDDRKCRCYLDDGDENVASLRQLIEAPEGVFTQEGWTPDMFPPRVEAARRTLATILAWQAEVQSRADACGLTAAREHETSLLEAARVRREAILAATPSSLREAAFQAAVLYAEWDETVASRLCKALAELAGITDYFEPEALGAQVAA